jgi:WD40 repeat protein
LCNVENGTPSKVQSLEFNASEAQYFLPGSTDNTFKLFDCTQSDNKGSQYKQWIAEGKVEKVKWNPNEKYHFIAGTNEEDTNRSGLLDLTKKKSTTLVSTLQR